MKTPGELVLDLAFKLERESKEVRDRLGTLVYYAVAAALKNASDQVRELGDKLVRMGS